MLFALVIRLISGFHQLGTIQQKQKKYAISVLHLNLVALMAWSMKSMGFGVD